MNRINFTRINVLMSTFSLHFGSSKLLQTQTESKSFFLPVGLLEI